MKFPGVRLDRNEFAGAFGDLGTDLPLIVGMLLVSDLDATNVLVMYGVLQIFSGFYYGIPMAVQPLKAVASIVIAQKICGAVILGAGLAIGVIMLVFSATGVLRKLSEFIPVIVIKGIQVGLGVLLGIIALKDYIIHRSDFIDIVLVLVTFLIGLVFIGNKKIPAALLIIVIGAVFALVFNIDQPSQLFAKVGFDLPEFSLPTSTNVLDGFFLLAIPQIPLSIGNSILASNQLATELFPEKKIGVTKIGWTYSLMNILSSFFGGVPVCHGSGGLMGHYTFGARTGGSVVIYGVMFLTLGLFFSNNFLEIVKLFPLQVLGVILLFEALSLISVIKIYQAPKKEVFLVLIVATCCVTLPFGFFTGMVVGTGLYYVERKFNLLKK